MIVIRAMKSADTGQVSGLEKQIFSQPWSQKGFEDSLALSGTVFLVAEEEGEILGYAGMYCAAGEGEITNVAVAPHRRSAGIGGMLVERLKEEAGHRSVDALNLEVRVSNESAIHLYEKNGFEICGVRKGFYEFPREDAYIMVYGQ